VPTQPRPPAPPAPAVDALPESPTETYQARTRNAGQRRRQQHKAQRAATKQASTKDKKNESALFLAPRLLLVALRCVAIARTKRASVDVCFWQVLPFVAERQK